MLKVQLSNVQLVSFIEAFLYLVEREDKHVPFYFAVVMPSLCGFSSGELSAR